MLNRSSLWAIGYDGFGWSNTAINSLPATDSKAFGLWFDPWTADPSVAPHARYLGFPVRCLV